MFRSPELKLGSRLITVGRNRLAPPDLVLDHLHCCYLLLQTAKCPLNFNGSSSVLHHQLLLLILYSFDDSLRKNFTAVKIIPTLVLNTHHMLDFCCSCHAFKQGALLFLFDAIHFKWDAAIITCTF